ncbi:MAG: diguanylate cyclase [Treponema sp.]|nr:diguanylate cyclase [Treponema sp.]
MSLIIGVYALFRGQSNKRNYFLLMQAAICVYLVGYLLELTSTNAEAAFTAVKVLYIGGFFLAPLAFFFVAEYCDIKLHPFLVKAPMILIATLAVLAMWTTETYKLVYVDFGYDPIVSKHLIFTPGILYFLIRIFVLACIAAIVVTMLFTLRKWKGKYRNRLLVFFGCAIIPSITEIIYVATIIMRINPYHINFTPYSVAIMSFFLYAGVVRFNIFEVIFAATISAMDHIKEGFVLVDEDNNYLASNPAAEEMFPGIGSIQKGEPVSTVKNWPIELMNIESTSIEFSMGDFEEVHFRASISPAYTQDKALMAKIIILSDITCSVELLKKLRNAAAYDNLTGLFNRKHFYELAAESIKRAQRNSRPAYAGMLDIDFFKKVNDTYGHDAGDIILQSTAAIIRQTIRSYDLVGRYGGEEFAFVITDMECEAMLKMVERIRENIESYVTTYEKEFLQDVRGREISYQKFSIKITCSIGVIKFSDDDSLESALKKADAALYAAKNGGRNQVKFCEGLVQSSAA